MIDDLKRGVAAGGVAGAAYGLFVWLVVSPLVGRIERAAEHAGGHGADAAATVVSAGGGVLWGVLLGAAFGAAYYLFEPALPGGDRRAYVLAGAGFLTVSAAPWTVLPPTVPGSDPRYGVDLLVAAYLGLIALGAVVAAASLIAYVRVRDARSSGDGRARGLALAAAAVPLAGLALLAVVAPPTHVAGDAPAELATAFRWTTAAGQAGLWLLIAAGFRRLRARDDDADPDGVAVPRPAD